MSSVFTERLTNISMRNSVRIPVSHLKVKFDVVYLELHPVFSESETNVFGKLTDQLVKPN